ncbi:MAG: efflux RND transporter periplasmic adaptor subunit [Bacteroidota bacterium]|nr:efflux RND transporter periplasmic adaptor subunit [Bacteroidota bacterium]
MKKIIYILSIITLVSACNVNEVEQKKKELSKLNKQVKELNEKIKALELELIKIDTSVKTVKKTEVRTEAVAKGDFKHYIDLQGDLISENNVMVNPKMGGLVTGVFVQEGQQVSAGQVLVQLDNSVLATSLQEIDNQLSLAKIVYEKQKRLWDQNIGTEIQYLQAKNNKESLEKRKATTQTQMAMSRIVAPFAGVVDEVKLKVGETAAPGMGGVRVINMKDLKITAKVSDTYAGSLKKGDKVKVNIPDLNLEFESQIKYVALNVNSASRTFEIEIAVPSNIKNLRPNLVARVSVNDANFKDVILVPLNLIQKTANGENVVMLAQTVNNQNRAISRFVKTGASYQDKIIVTEGLEVGDQIIVEGNNDLIDGQILNIIK